VELFWRARVRPSAEACGNQETLANEAFAGYLIEDPADLPSLTIILHWDTGVEDLFGDIIYLGNAN
jgi:hypothetical protein